MRLRIEHAQKIYEGGHGEIYSDGNYSIELRGDWCGSAPLTESRDSVTLIVRKHKSDD